MAKMPRLGMGTLEDYESLALGGLQADNLSPWIHVKESQISVDYTVTCYLWLISW